MADTTPTDPAGRRSEDRRQAASAALPFADRRQGERRTGDDRRRTPRA